MDTSDPALQVSGPAFSNNRYGRRQRRAVMVCLQFLRASGYSTAADTLFHESELALEGEEKHLAEEDVLFEALEALDEKRGRGAHTAIKRALVELEITKDADETPIRKQAHSFDKLHNKSNIITLKFDPHNPSQFVTGAVDRTLRVFDWKTKELKRSLNVVSAPILSLDLHPTIRGYAVVGCMSGEHCVVDLSDNAQESPVVQKFHKHKKFVIAARWSPDGKFLATGSHDATVCIFQLNPGGEEEEQKDAQEEKGKFRLLKTFYFQDRVEALEWIGGTEKPLLVVSSRGDNYLTLIDPVTLNVENRWNMNVLGDDHVSFTCLDLKLSPDRKLLLAATESGGQVRNFYGALNDEYSNPRVCFSHDGTFVYATSQDNNSIYGWDLGTEKQVARLEGHAQTLRGLDSHPTEALLISCSYDKSVKLWEP